METIKWTLKYWRASLGETGDYDSGVNLERNGKTIAIITEECTDEEVELIAKAPEMAAELEQLRSERDKMREGWKE